MSGTFDTVRGFVTEIRTESATAEVALWTVSISVAAYVGAVFAGRWTRPRGEAAVSAAGKWGAVRFAALAVVFTLVAVQVSGAGWLTGADAATLDWFVAHRFAGATATAVVITDVAGPVGVAVVAVVAAAQTSWRRRSWAPGLLIVGTVAVAAVASTVTKMIVGRSRPPVATQLVTEADWSFPSGHTTGIVAFAGILLVVLGARVRTTAGRVIAVSVAVLVVTVVAATRLYLGVHWLTDVVGGALLGGAVVTAGSLAAAALAARNPPPGAVAPATTSHTGSTPTDNPGGVRNTARLKRGVGHDHRPLSTR